MIRSQVLTEPKFLLVKKSISDAGRGPQNLELSGQGKQTFGRSNSWQQEKHAGLHYDLLRDYNREASTAVDSQQS